jgi:hypothetical protein
VTSGRDAGLARRVGVGHDKGSHVLRIFSGLVTLFPERGSGRPPPCAMVGTVYFPLTSFSPNSFGSGC